MASYTKLFSSIVTSTIWTEDDKTRIAWITMLAIADKNGEVQASIPGLARIAGLSIEDTEAAIAKFLSPDKYSRTPDDGGRRIEPISGGWLLLNHSKYRALASKDESIASNAERQRKHRERQKRNATVTDCNALVTDRNATVTHDRDIAEEEAEAEADPLEDKVAENDAKASEVVAFWNSLNELPKVRTITAGRRKQIKSRMTQHFFRENWKSAIHKLLESPFLTGTNDRGWRADFDWFIKPESVPRIMEGKYDHKAPAKTYSHANGYNESTSLDHL